MLNRKHLLILTSSMVVSVLVGSLVVYSMVQAQEAGEYDSWMDINDDGKIDIKDVSAVARKFGSSGTPINKTGLLLELLDKVENLTTRVGTLENMKGLPKPDYDSGWIEYTATLTHNLNTTQLLVYVIGNSTDAGGYFGINQMYYGIDEYWKDEGFGVISHRLGIFWFKLTNTTIRFSRAESQDFSYPIFRVRMWKIPEP